MYKEDEVSMRLLRANAKVITLKLLLKIALNRSDPITFLKLTRTTLHGRGKFQSRSTSSLKVNIEWSPWQRKPTAFTFFVCLLKL